MKPPIPMQRPAPPQAHPLQPFLDADVDVCYFEPDMAGEEAKQKFLRVRCRLTHIDAGVLIVRLIGGKHRLIERRFIHSIETCSIQGAPSLMVQ